MGPNASAVRRIAGTDLARARAFAGIRTAYPQPQEVSGLQPDEVLRRVAGRPYPVYLWGDGDPVSGRYSIVAHSPRATLRCRGGRSILESGGHRLVLNTDGLVLAAALSREPGADDTDGLPFNGGAIGFVTYEHGLRYLGVPSPTDEVPLPSLHFAFYDSAFIYDHHAQTACTVGAFELPGRTDTAGHRSWPAGGWRCSVDKPTYVSHVKRILDHIAAGDIYQANFTVRFEAEAVVNAVDAALRLRSENPSPLGAFMRFPFGSIWSCSPELLLASDGSGRLESRPIKGTRRRGGDPAEDATLRDELAGSAKDRAELLMIVDLIRNDLGRVANYGSVEVDTLFGVRSFANVHHLESTVTARCRDGADAGEVLRMLLPGGSVTGAPKRRAVEILSGLERVPRSVYTGAVGYFSRCGRSQFNLPIRTAYHDGHTLYIHSGGGIVADSDPESEWDELLTKIDNMRAIFQAS